MFYSFFQSVSKLWIRWQTPFLWLLIVIMAGKAVSRIYYGLTCLLFLIGTKPAVDLIQRYNEVQLWFSGGDVYSQLKEGGVYPPASHVILWPLLQYSSFSFVRYLWAITTIICLLWLVYLLVQSSEASNIREKSLIALMSLSTYATNVNLINGQLTIHLLAFLVAGLTLIRTKNGFKNVVKVSLLAGFLLAIALVKPTITVPFFLIFLLVPKLWLVAVFASVIYAGFALTATAFQNSSIVALHIDWLKRGKFGTVEGSISDSNMLAGYGDIHNFLGSMGVKDFNLESSILILVIFAIWLYFHRSINLWILIGVAALVSRFWAYHRIYDDMVILLPMVTLFRLSKQTNLDQTNRFLSGIVLAIAIFATFLVDQLLQFNPPKNFLFASGQTIVWFVMLIFLLFQAYREKNSQLNLYKNLKQSIKF